MTQCAIEKISVYRTTPFSSESLVLQKIQEEDGKETLKFWICNTHSYKIFAPWITVHWPKIIWREADSENVRQEMYTVQLNSNCIRSPYVPEALVSLIKFTTQYNNNNTWHLTSNSKEYPPPQPLAWIAIILLSE